jgi:hypothetical protein
VTPLLFGLETKLYKKRFILVLKERISSIG